MKIGFMQEWLRVELNDCFMWLLLFPDVFHIILSICCIQVLATHNAQLVSQDSEVDGCTRKSTILAAGSSMSLAFPVLHDLVTAARLLNQFPIFPLPLLSSRHVISWVKNKTSQPAFPPSCSRRVIDVMLAWGEDKRVFDWTSLSRKGRNESPSWAVCVTKA